jgi:hypothetical protein
MNKCSIGSVAGRVKAGGLRLAEVDLGIVADVEASGLALDLGIAADEGMGEDDIVQVGERAYDRIF